MPTEMLLVGFNWTMKANQIYALPPPKVVMYTDATTPTVAQSGSVDFTRSTPVTFDAGVAELSGAFVRATADTPVILKRA